MLEYQPSKHRPKGHEYNDKGRGAFIKRLSRFSPNEFRDNDYGIDFVLTLTENNSEDNQLSTDDFYVQLKSSGKSSTDLRAGDDIFWDLKIDDLLFLHRRQLPTLLIIYEVETDTLYWENIQKYVWDVLDEDSKQWRQQVKKRIKINTQQTVDDNLNEIRNTIQDVQRRIILRRTLEFGQDTLLQSAYWTAKSVIEQTHILCSKETTELKYNKEIESYRKEAKPIVERLNEVRDKSSIKPIELLKLSEKAVQIRDNLFFLLSSEPTLTDDEANQFKSEFSCPICERSLSSPYIDDDEVFCSSCGWQGREGDLKWKYSGSDQL